MHHFTARGVWYTGDQPERRVTGTIRFSKTGIHLELIGSFTEGWNPGVGSYPVIHGVVDKTPYGPYVSLYDGFMKSRQMFTADVGQEVIFANRGVVGSSALESEPNQFEVLKVRLSHLDDWYG